MYTTQKRAAIMPILKRKEILRTRRRIIKQIQERNKEYKSIK